METFHAPKEPEELNEKDTPLKKESISEKWLLERLDSLIPLIQERWPNIAKQTIEATKGGLDELVAIISKQTETPSAGIKEQLFEIIDSIKTNKWEISEHIEPIESQLEELLDELNNTLRPQIENPIRKKPILSIVIAAGIGLFIGSLITSGRK